MDIMLVLFLLFVSGVCIFVVVVCIVLMKYALEEYARQQEVQKQREWIKEHGTYEEKMLVLMEEQNERLENMGRAAAYYFMTHDGGPDKMP